MPSNGTKYTRSDYAVYLKREQGTSGAGTWGPPLRLGSNPEIVMLEFQKS